MSNDANCFALSEATDGAGAGARVVFGVILGTGVGGGIVVDGRALDGPNGIAGEWGHNPLPWPRDDERPGAACFCGRSGCIETFLSGPGLERDHARAIGALPATPPTAGGDGGATPTAAAVGAAAAAGDVAAQQTLARYEERLARALAHVINVLDPDVIVLGGGHVQHRTPLRPGAGAMGTVGVQRSRRHPAGAQPPRRLERSARGRVAGFGGRHRIRRSLTAAAAVRRAFGCRSTRAARRYMFG